MEKLSLEKALSSALFQNGVLVHVHTYTMGFYDVMLCILQSSHPSHPTAFAPHLDLTQREHGNSLLLGRVSCFLTLRHLMVMVILTIWRYQSPFSHQVLITHLPHISPTVHNSKQSPIQRQRHGLDLL